ncbi:hypothetical protein [Treponema sp. Marseille-Q4130]|uniref:Nmad2 family putative nucleotide modification protein n=1 Tax=Treponema sp. Marseille-Q4130 TaxID=2766702 RepID=UPI0016522FD3|nr:hypothetical protein [Treponema sp. Marseille-Q4130]MBC6720512.1 hypothetical protein [Treponema sp. Marseille-Q4130]
MKLYTYVITRDFGFAPNPFYGCCTLATCKPRIRKAAIIGDWIVGFGSFAQDSKLKNRIIFAMQVEGKMTFDEYWNSEQFLQKHPYLQGSLKQCYGDNIYHKINGKYVQENSHHSYKDGNENIYNKKRDLSCEYVVYGHTFWYWGKDAILCDVKYRRFAPECRSHRVFDSTNDIRVGKFVEWIKSQGDCGIYGFPKEFSDEFKRYGGEK